MSKDQTQEIDVYLIVFLHKISYLRGMGFMGENQQLSLKIQFMEQVQFSDVFFPHICGISSFSENLIFKASSTQLSSSTQEISLTFSLLTHSEDSSANQGLASFPLNQHKA